MQEIRYFKGDFEYLSNFSRHSFVDEGGTEWKTVEHYYQAQKTTHPLWRMLIWEAPTPAAAKKEGRACKLRDDWDEVKGDIMLKAVRMKFEQNDDIRKKLISTDGFMLIEGNTWHDNTWGVCYCGRCKPENAGNRLGGILMYLRDKFIEKEKNNE